MTTLRADHLALPIFDVAGTLVFWSEVLGLPLVEAVSGDDWGGKPWLMMIFGLADGRQVALVALDGAKRVSDGLPADVKHVAFAVSARHELATWKDRLAKASVAFTVEDHGTQLSLYFQDPNGITLEITSPGERDHSRSSADAFAVVERWLRHRPA